MTTATARQAIRRLILDRHPILGFYATADSVSTTAIVDLSEFGHSRYGGDSWADFYIYRPERTGNDIIKIATTVAVATGTLSHGGSNYSNTSDTEYEILGPLHPDELNQKIIQALRHMHYPFWLAMTLSEYDFDMETSGVNFWDGTSGGSAASNATPTKTTDDEDVRTGTQALSIATSDATNYIRSATFPVVPGSNLVIYIMGKAEVGTLQVQFRDVTNSALFGTQVTYDGEEYARIRLQATVPSTCEDAQLQISSAATSATLHIDTLYGPYKQGQRRFELPSYIDENWKIHYLRPLHYAYEFGSNLAAGYSEEPWSAEGDWVAPQHWSLETRHREANQYLLQLKRGHDLSDTPYQIVCGRPWSDVDTLSTESATTTAPLEQLLDLACREIFSLLHARDRSNKTWAELYERYKDYAEIEELARPWPASVPRRGMRRIVA